MNRVAQLAVCAGIVLALSGCTGADSTRHDASEYAGGKDVRLFNVRITSQDRLLHKGDFDVELPLNGLRTGDRAAGTSTQLMHSLSNSQNLTEVYPNPSIAPKQGNYSENVIATAVSYFGTPYEYSSDREDPSTFDCSDFIHWTFLYSLGMDLPKDSRSQASYVQTYSRRYYTNIREAVRGDLLFFIGFDGTDPEQYRYKDKSISNISHCGLYLGNGKMIHTASAATGGVRIDDVFDNHLEWRFVSGGSAFEVK
ncbi:MAG: hydrolase Nlp/P60 [Paenibacillus sp.]|jgi:cell wall-associated NlpC family hydrolase|nr:hydrolase Nlp/P60 [Paenibacillus sp.]